MFRVIFYLKKQFYTDNVCASMKNSIQMSGLLAYPFKACKCFKDSSLDNALMLVLVLVPRQSPSTSAGTSTSSSASTSSS